MKPYASLQEAYCRWTGTNSWDFDPTVMVESFGDFGSVFAQTVANSPFGYISDGTVDGTDFAQFGARFGTTL